ncbi:class I SAM-dependent methyltransferase [Mucilaginibacter sp. dw_454]|uniref:class I SAM-dependent methyltransferase n=1 Tax=Mucilaginibacter sp. dw_454 TaxID=2720079 RepID=UPI001BD3B069|nr:class I SAM-dependent methyltransferase [Mucilaginibacter sp. dw_454]
MESQLEKIREQQKQSWNKFSPGWKKWDEFNMAFLHPMGEAIIKQLSITETDHVLDIATGTGEPGLTIAALATQGKVTGTDLAEGMLEVAQQNAKEKGLPNYETLTADAGELPFSDDSFDAISCRMGFMFFPDMQQAANEMYRVLKPGGRIAVSVWGNPAHNDWVNTIMSVIKKHIEIPPPAPGSPGMFRCAAPNLMSDLFKQAGFKNIEEATITDKAAYKTFDQYWEIMLDVGAPIVAAMAGATEETVAAIRTETAALFKSKNPGGGAELCYDALIISGVK